MAGADSGGLAACDVRFLSCFPREAMYLLPPGTYLHSPSGDIDAVADDGPHGGIAIRPLKQVAIFGMQPARPRIHAMGPVQPDDGDALAVYLVLGIF